MALLEPAADPRSVRACFVVGVPNVTELLGGTDLLVLAFFLEPAPSLTPDAALAALDRWGLVMRQRRSALELLRDELPRPNRRFFVREGAFVPRSAAAIAQHLDELLGRLRIDGVLLSEFKPDRTMVARYEILRDRGALAARPASVSARGAKTRGEQAAASARGAKARGEQAASARDAKARGGHAAGAGRGAAARAKAGEAGGTFAGEAGGTSNGRAASTSAGKAASASAGRAGLAEASAEGAGAAAEPALPPAAPLSEAPFRYEGPAAATLEALLRPSAPLAEVARVLRAHAIASAEQFEDLISLPGLRGVEPHRYQLEAVRRVLRVLRGRALLADEVGLGKTVEAIIALREYQLRGMARRALVVVPAPLVGQWLDELWSKAGVAARAAEGPAFRDDPEGLLGGEGVVVASLAAARSARLAPLFQGREWDLVVVDEAHHVKNRATLGWKLVDGLRSRFLLLLTATPVETELEEIYNLVTLLKPGQLSTPAAFRKEYVDAKNPTSPKNRERLRGLLADVMVRNTRARSGLRLPPRFVTTVAVDPLDEERALYDAVVAHFREHAGEPAARLASATLLLEAGSSPRALAATLGRMAEGRKQRAGFARGLGALVEAAARVTTTRKAEALASIARAEPGKLLVFTKYRETLAFVEQVLRAEGVPTVAFHGGLGADAKRQALEAFRGGARAMVATDVGGEGQNLQFCSRLVNFDLPWNPMLIEQRIGRLHRMGQTDEVRVWNLCARGSAEERLLDVLDRRLNLFELVVGEMDMVLGNLADERDLEERVLDLYAASGGEGDVERGFDALAAELAAARARYDRSTALDAALFGRDFET
jgi:superfamily II DNA or RNA helicase